MLFLSSVELLYEYLSIIYLYSGDFGTAKSNCGYLEDCIRKQKCAVIGEDLLLEGSTKHPAPMLNNKAWCLSSEESIRILLESEHTFTPPVEDCLCASGVHEGLVLVNRL